MTEKTQALDILTSIAKLLSEAPGSLRDHQMRLNSIEFLRQRIEKLDEMEQSSSNQEPVLVE